MSKRACVLFRSSGYYKIPEFTVGLERHGYTVTSEWRRNPDSDDLLLLWNRPRGYESIALAYERAGAKLLIAENGYLGQPAGGGKFYALALNHHNGAGRWYVGDGPRYEIPEQPWRTGGDRIVLLPQRGFGELGVAMPTSWLGAVKQRLARITGRPVVIRAHPGPDKSDPVPELLGAHCAVTWGSGAGIKAIQAGIPVFHELGKWIGNCAATRLAGDIEACNTPSREALWRRISWAQWELGEIQSGEAFDRLINQARHDLFCAERAPLYAGGASLGARGTCDPVSGLPG